MLRKARIFFPEFNIRLYDKNSELYFFFFTPPKSEYFFQQHWESEYFFRTPPFKLNGRSLRSFPLKRSILCIFLCAKFDQFLLWWFLGGLLSKLCLTPGTLILHSRWPLLLKNKMYFRFKFKLCTATSQWIMKHIFYVFVWIFSFSSFILIMQIRLFFYA